MVNQLLIKAAERGDVEKNFIKIVGNISKDDIYDTFRDDAWLRNVALNVWERNHGATELESYPLDVSIPLLDACNVKCVFCSYWKAKPRFMSVEELHDNYSELFRYAKLVGINPAGEPFLHPRIAEILRAMRDMTDSRCTTYVGTNGILLDDKYDLILETVDSLSFSLNAASPGTYAKVMGTKPEAFQRVINNIKNLNELKKGRKRRLHLYATFVVLKDNINEIPAFVKLVDELGFTKVWIRALATPNDNNPIKPNLNDDYQKLYPYLHHDFEQLREQAIEALTSAETDIYAEPELWDDRDTIDEQEKPLFPVRESDDIRKFKVVSGSGRKISGMDNPYWSEVAEEEFPYSCDYPYRFFMDQRISNIQPVCVFQDQLPGYEEVTFDIKNKSFKDIWNSEAHQALRSALKNGPKLPNVCLKCNFLRDFKKGC